jgi:uncharacterized membrane protein YkvA (DUF1232 family)
MSERVNKIWAKATETVKSNEKVNRLVDSVGDKMKKINLSHEDRDKFIDSLEIFIRMIKAQYKGTYRSFSTKTILIIVFGLVYFLTPTDLIPDFIPVLGLTDDISLVLYLVNSIANDVTAFREWESEQEVVINNA